MKKILLSGVNKENRFLLVDDEDYEKVKMYKWYFSKGAARHSYSKKPLRGRSIAAHYLIIQVPKGKQVKFLDENELNCQKSNLQIVTPGEKVIGRSAIRKDGVKGIYFLRSKDKWFKDKWIAHIGVNGRTISLGCFDAKEEAIKAYNEAAFKYFGKHAFLNII